MFSKTSGIFRSGFMKINIYSCSNMELWKKGTKVIQIYYIKATQFLYSYLYPVQNKMPLDICNKPGFARGFLF